MKLGQFSMLFGWILLDCWLLGLLLFQWLFFWRPIIKDCCLAKFFLHFLLAEYCLITCFATHFVCMVVVWLILFDCYLVVCFKDYCQLAKCSLDKYNLYFIVIFLFGVWLPVVRLPVIWLPVLWVLVFLWKKLDGVGLVDNRPSTD